MSRKYLYDTEEIKTNKDGSTTSIPKTAWVNLNCKYCRGTGIESYRGEKHGLDDEGHQLYNHYDVPCRCIKYIKKEANENPTPTL